MKKIAFFGDYNFFKELQKAISASYDIELFKHALQFYQDPVFSADYFIIQINMQPHFTENIGFEEVLNIRARLSYSQPIIMLSFRQLNTLNSQVKKFIQISPNSNIFLHLPFSIEQLYKVINHCNGNTDNDALCEYLNEIGYLKKLHHECRSDKTSSLIKYINEKCFLKFNYKRQANEKKLQ